MTKALGFSTPGALFLFNVLFSGKNYKRGDTLKEFLKMMGLIIVGLLTAAIIYPLLHEVGHSLVALLVGARITEFNILPIPFVECEISNVDIIGQTLSGLGGIVFPFIMSMLLKPKWFWSWYASLILRCISVYSVILSIIATVLHINGNSWQNEDIVQVLHLFPNGTWLLLIVLSIMGTYGLMRILKEKVLSRCLDYFNKTESATV